ncbi:thiamine pyrophosphate-requiring protein [Sphingomonas sp. Root50]|uniref:thiamine pyrophosphate-requiring protein n=1 Tax=Sphingomonas sp. Root50 TaxID=1736551 RepID=UPI002285D15F|nr:thiamine pyrophosphate-requiring protein [Sphingomonas sp. Root50]
MPSASHETETRTMKVGAAIAEILKREGVEYIFGYPVNMITEFAADADIRSIIARSERVAGHMADAMSRVSSGENIGVYFMQHGPGIENGMGAVAQAFGESVPILVIPMGYARNEAWVEPNFNSSVSLRSFSKSVEPVVSGKHLPDVMRRAFSRLRSGRGGPVVVEVPIDMWDEEVPEPLRYTPVRKVRSGPDPDAIVEAADMLLAAERPVIYAGQGIHYAKAWPQLCCLAETLGAPVTTSLEGKSAFDETHPLSLGSGGLALPRTVRHFLDNADVIFGVGCSFTKTLFGVPMPRGKRFIHATLDPAHFDNEVPVTIGILGDAALTLDALIAEIDRRLDGKARDWSAVVEEIDMVRAEWMAAWAPKLTSDETPITPYRVIGDLMKTVDVANTVITHDAGSPRDQLSPFWRAVTPLGYLGWGKTTQLGYGLGLAMGAKVAHPDKLCINLWGDAAIGFTGMDFETCVRERIPILSILFNNFSMAMETHIMKRSHEKFGTIDISGDYAAMARAFGGYGERVTDPAEIVPALRRAIAQTEAGVPVLLEFITCKELATSKETQRYAQAERPAN